jgi:hypothetical protein
MTHANSLPVVIVGSPRLPEVALQETSWYSTDDSVGRFFVAVLYPFVDDDVIKEFFDSAAILDLKHYSIVSTS